MPGCFGINNQFMYGIIFRKYQLGNFFYKKYT